MIFRKKTKKVKRIVKKIPKQPSPPKKEQPERSTAVQKADPIKTEDFRKKFLEMFRQLTYRHRPFDVWRDFIVIVACSLSNVVDKAHWDERESRYLQIIQRYNEQEQQAFPELAAYTVMALDSNPEQDFLGSIFMELELGNDSGGQFFTPYSICELMAKITMADVEERIKTNGVVTIHDPCCGAGATIIAGFHEARRKLEKVGRNAQHHVLVAAQDIDETVALMCYIQLSLLGIAGYVKVGDSISDPISTEDNGKGYWYTPMYFSEIWTWRRVFGLRGERDL